MIFTQTELGSLLKNYARLITRVVLESPLLKGSWNSHWTMRFLLRGVVHWHGFWRASPLWMRFSLIPLCT